MACLFGLLGLSDRSLCLRFRELATTVFAQTAAQAADAAEAARIGRLGPQPRSFNLSERWGSVKDVLQPFRV